MACKSRAPRGQATWRRRRTPCRLAATVSTGSTFQGRIDEVRVYNVALTAAQIQTDMATPVAGGGGTLTPDLTVTKTHAGPFTQGQVGATYTLTVSNAARARRRAR